MFSDLYRLNMMMNQSNNLVVYSLWAELLLWDAGVLDWILAGVILHRGPLITTEYFTASEWASYKLDFTLGVVSAMASKISPLVIQSWQWVDEQFRLCVQSVVSWARGRGVWIRCFSTFQFYKSLFLGFEFVDEEFWSELGFGLVDAVRG